VRSKLRWIIIVAFVFPAAMALAWMTRAKHALDEARVDVTAPKIPYEVHPVSDSKPTGIDFLPTPPDFKDAQLFHDSLYVCGSGGLWVYDLAGNLKTRYLAGRDLPASPLVAMTVGTVAGDAEQKLWIGTANAGILSFDGIRFVQIDIQAKGNGGITSLLMLPAGNLLAGFSEGGVLSYSGTTLVPFHPELRKIPVTALGGTEGDLWIGTRDRGVIHWQAGSGKTTGDQNGLPDNRVLSIAVSGDRTYVGTPLGTTEFRDGEPVRNLAEGVFSQSLLLEKDHLLIGTMDEGVIDVLRNNGRAGRFVPDSNLGPHTARRLYAWDEKTFALTPDSLMERESTGLWTRRIGLENPHLADRNVSALAVDSAGRLWIGYFDRGVDIVDAAGFQNRIHVEDDQVFCVNRIVQDTQHNTRIVATANGVVLFSPDGKILRRIAERDGLISEHVSDVAVRPEGLAVATAAGVTLMDSSGPESIYAFQGLVNNHVYALGVNGSRLLAGTLGGLSVIQDGFVRASYTTSNSPLQQNWISAIVPLGDTWFIGTYGGGVIQFSADGQWTEFPDFPRSAVINANAMLAVSERVLAGTLDRGLFIYDPAGHRWTPMTVGLPSMNVTALAASADKVFVGTDNGIVQMPIERLSP
jgi:ligand-binding sensor domain-containing protein